MVASQRHAQATRLLRRDSLVDELLDIPLRGSFELPIRGLFADLLLALPLLLPLELLVAPNHTPFLVHGKAGEVLEASGEHDVLDHSLDLLVVRARKEELLGRSEAVKMGGYAGEMGMLNFQRREGGREARLAGGLAGAASGYRGIGEGS